MESPNSMRGPAMETQYTPGPWTVDYPAPTDARIMIRESDENATVAIVIPNEVGPVHTPANARLIAAAPELLAALQAFCTWAEINRTMRGAPMRSEPYRLARAAIAKVQP